MTRPFSSLLEPRHRMEDNGISAATSALSYIPINASDIEMSLSEIFGNGSKKN
jgi:hypothetical protein